MSGQALPRAHGAAVLQATMRATPDDFRVDELDAFEAGGSGEHLLLRIEKRGMTTAFAARLVAEWAGVAESAIGHAGLKDRHAVTTQRLSVWLPKKIAPAPGSLDRDGLRVLDAAWHARKLPRGALAGNRFALVLRDVAGDPRDIEARLQTIAARGVPNYFGEQRFGLGGRNVEQALSMFAGRRVKREQRGMLLSAARSDLFNRVLATRVSAGTWDRALDGEVWMLDGSHSVFGPQAWDAALASRLQAFDIHPTGPLWGRGALRTDADAHALEAAALASADAAALRAGLEAAGLRQERRSLRLLPRGLAWEWRDAGTLALAFALPPGAYATVVMHALGDVRDAQAREAASAPA